VLMVDSSSAGARERYPFGRMERKEEGGRAKMTCERLNERGERRESFIFFIKKIYWVATVLPNVLGSTVATQA